MWYTEEQKRKTIWPYIYQTQRSRWLGMRCTPPLCSIRRASIMTIFRNSQGRWWHMYMCIQRVISSCSIVLKLFVLLV